MGKQLTGSHRRTYSAAWATCNCEVTCLAAVRVFSVAQKLRDELAHPAVTLQEARSVAGVLRLGRGAQT
jgi:hypothetical protein